MEGKCHRQCRAGGGAISRGYRRREVRIGRDTWVTLLEVSSCVLRRQTSPDRSAVRGFLFANQARLWGARAATELADAGTAQWSISMISSYIDQAFDWDYCPGGLRWKHRL